ncbi:MAG TPA: hypothetical protein VHA37_00165, partial [Candidatus Saccharimonadales bacterium]|nr:hypothetical protein [Candidatus Saccharimonadales bacterium]
CLRTEAKAVSKSSRHYRSLNGAQSRERIWGPQALSLEPRLDSQIWAMAKIATHRLATPLERPQAHHHHIEPVDLGGAAMLAAEMSEQQLRPELPEPEL